MWDQLHKMVRKLMRCRTHETSGMAKIDKRVEGYL